MKRPLLVALVGLALALSALVGWLYHKGPEDEPPVILPGVAEPPPMIKPATPVTPGQQAAQPSGGGERGPMAPVFDAVRLTPKGDAVVAGRATPGAEVLILDQESEIGRVHADSRGEWVFLPAEPLPSGKRVLSLKSKEPDGKSLVSAGTVELVVPERSLKSQQQAPEVRIGEGEAQTAAGKAAARTEPPSLSIDLDEDEKTGQVAVSGQASPGLHVQLFVDNRFYVRLEADKNGRWRLKTPLTFPDRKRHVVRAEEVGADGKVKARAEGFVIREEGLIDLVRDPVVVVKPGWDVARIAKRYYGDEAAAKMILEANKSQIAKPDALFPGQTLYLPNQGQ